MKQYRLKKEVRLLFDERYCGKIKEIEYWEKEKFRLELLDEVENVHIEYGSLSNPSSNIKNLKDWTSDGKKARFYFTLNVLDIENQLYEKADISELMSELQKTANKFFKTK